MTEGSNDRPRRTKTRASTMLPPSPWPSEVDIAGMYRADRAQLDSVIANALDLSVWSLESKKDGTAIYLHCKNNESLAYSVKAVTHVAGTVHNVVECLRGLDSSLLRQFARRLHAKIFVDSELLCAHQEMNLMPGVESESLGLKWMAFASGKTGLTTGKEFCVREYCAVVSNHRQFGTVGVCKFESYDGVGARYSVRAKPDTYSLTVFEPSSFVVVPTQDDGMLQITLTFSMRKARGKESVSPGVKALSLRFAQDLANFQQAMQHALFQPAALAEKESWVNDKKRSNCSLCVQSFSMLRRKHHCRVCGEIVCSSCTLFKTITGKDSSDISRIRVCKACLGKSSTTDIPMPTIGAGTPVLTTAPEPLARASTRSYGGGPGSPRPRSNGVKQPALSMVSTSSGTSSSSDESRRSGVDDVESVGSMPYFQAPQMHRTLSSLYSKKPSFSDSDTKSVGSSSPRSTHSSSSSYQGTSKSRSSRNERRTHYFNDDFADICQLAMETMGCVMAGIRTDDMELVNYSDGLMHPELPRSLPTFRRIASRGKPCIVLDVSADQRIAGERRAAAKLQFFVGIPLIMDGEVIGDLCVADRYARDSIDYKAVEVLMVLGKTATRYMVQDQYQEDLAAFKASRQARASRREAPPQQELAQASSNALAGLPHPREVAF